MEMMMILSKKNGSFLFLSDSCFKIGQAFILNVSLGIHL